VIYGTPLNSEPSVLIVQGVSNIVSLLIELSRDGVRLREKVTNIKSVPNK
jgi:hypothetical protein